MSLMLLPIFVQSKLHPAVIKCLSHVMEVSKYVFFHGFLYVSHRKMCKLTIKYQLNWLLFCNHTKFSKFFKPQPKSLCSHPSIVLCSKKIFFSGGLSSHNELSQFSPANIIKGSNVTG